MKGTGAKPKQQNFKNAFFSLCLSRDLKFCSCKKIRTRLDHSRLNIGSDQVELELEVVEIQICSRKAVQKLKFVLMTFYDILSF